MRLMEKNKGTIKKVNIYSLFGDGYDGVHGDYFDGDTYELEENADFWECVKPLVIEHEARYEEACEKYEKKWNRKPVFSPTYIRIKSDEDFEKLKNDEKVISYCKEARVNIHLIHENWSSYFDLYDNKSYELYFEEEPGNVDDAATYLYITRKERIPE